MGPIVEEAARHLCRWRGTGMAWNAELEWTTPSDPENAEHDRLAVAWRGRLEEGAGKSILGSGHVRQHRTWARSAKAAVIPSHRSGCDVAAALAMAELDGPLEAILLLVCCEDFTRWPEVKRYAVAALRHPHAGEAATDAMHRIMWRRPAIPLAARARSLVTRKQAYSSLRACAEATFQDWLDLAAERFLTALC